tara:strand:- start:31 stop:963 length:933 start_codon:yes stop_codon:yes gene_type:complete
MSLLTSIKSFKNERERYSYTILTYSYKNEDLIDTLKKKLENMNKKIKDAHKKKFINERVFSLISNLESAFKLNEEVNGIFLVNSKINKILFSKDDLNFCKNWSLPKLTFDYDDRFDIEYLTKLFSTDAIKTVFKFSKSDYQVLEIDSTKNRKIGTHTGIEEDHINFMVQKHKPSIIYGQNQILKKLTGLEKEGIIVDMRNITNEEVIEMINQKNIKENQEQFKKEFLDNLNNPSESDKLLYGRNEIIEAINNYMVKKLFINPKLYNILLDNVEDSVLNFDIIIVQPNQPGDYGQQLNKDYGGIVAIKYYA